MNLLDPFPKKLLEDIAKEKDHLPAIMDEDNVDEFRKIYDDSWAFRYKPLTGKKKTPPTKPYVEMLLLYDLLKKDAKRLAFNKYNVSKRQIYWKFMFSIMLFLIYQTSFFNMDWQPYFFHCFEVN